MESGLPFAFWICDRTLSAHERQGIFNSLTQGDRFTLLEKITTLRKKLGDTHLGIFYEDPDYTPTIAPCLEWAQ